VTLSPDNASEGSVSPDISGSLRARKAFRLSVFSLFLFTGLLCFSELQLKYSQPESLYINALTLPRDSSRVFLVQAIRLDKERNETQNPKYSKALAVREENDKVLQSFPEALELDSEDVLFRIRYVSRLLAMGRPFLALEQIAQIEELDAGKSSNALTGYLKAAAIIMKGDRKSAIRAAMIEIARTNNSTAKVVYPTPFWFSEYPKTGKQYADHTREIADEVLTPLRLLLRLSLSEMKREIRNGNTTEIRTWIQELNLMGIQIYEDSETAGVRQALFGIQCQLRMNELTQKVNANSVESDLNALIEEKIRLEDMLGLLNDFESKRPGSIQLESRKISQSTSLAVVTWIVSFLLWLLFVFQNAFWSPYQESWTIPIGIYGKIIIATGILFISIVLITMVNFSMKDGYIAEFWDSTSEIWKYSVGIFFIVGLFYPFYLLSDYPSLKYAKRGDSFYSRILSSVPKFSSWALVTRRYYGLVFGWYTILMCLSIIAYFLIFRLFPWQFNLISNGLLDVEKELLYVLTAN
jgi:hypothetical protein